MNNPYLFTDKNIQAGFEIDLDGHHINLANSKLFIKPISQDFGIETRYFDEILKEMAVIYARLINQ